MTDPNAKPWYQSRSIMGALVSMLAMLAGTLGVAISPELQNEIVTALITLAGVIGTGVSIYGRVKASKPIKPPSARAGKMMLVAVALGALSVGGPVACASYTSMQAEEASAEQTVYALQADYNAVLASAAAYAGSDAADPDAVDAIRRLDDAAFDALREAQVAARAGDAAVTAAAVSVARSAIAELARHLMNLEATR